MEDVKIVRVYGKPLQGKGRKVEKISVIVPIYNSEAYLSRCLNSIIHQTYSNLEIILVNDGSTDGSLSKCMEYKEKDDRILVISKPNGGLSSARNIAMEQASGKYFAFVDSDDYIAPNYIKLLYRLLTEYHADIAVTHCIRGSNDQYRFKEDTGRVQVYPKLAFIEARLVQGDSAGAWGKLYKSSLFKNIRYPEGMLWEDICISAQLFYEANFIVEMESPLYYYFHNRNSIVHSKFNKTNLQAVAAYEIRLRFLQEKNLLKAYKRFLVQYIAILLQYYYRVKRHLPEEQTLCKDIYAKICRSYEEIKKDRDVSYIFKCAVRSGMIFPYCMGKLVDFII